MQDRIRLAHGSGGRLARELLEELFLARFRSLPLQKQGEAALLPLPPEGRLAVSTQACVVRPLFFPGGDIGRLALLRATNNLAAAGASPRWAAAAFTLREGVRWKDLARIVDSLARAAAEATVELVAGDTRVLEPGSGEDEILITVTAGGVVDPKRDLSRRRAREGDHLLVTGPPGEHAAAVLAAREGAVRGGEVASDARSLHAFTRAALRVEGVRRLADAGRAGLGGALLRLAGELSARLTLRRDALPVRPVVADVLRHAGLDPLFASSAGVLIAVASPAAADRLLTIWSRLPGGEGTARVGMVGQPGRSEVLLEEGRGRLRPLVLPADLHIARIG